MNATESRRSWPSDETPIEDLGLWTRALNALRRAGVRTVGGLGRKTDADLLRLRGFGPGALAAVRAVVPPPPTRTASTDRDEAVRPIQAAEDS
jgi:DNA-directed RNA polymerase alpha subunit